MSVDSQPQYSAEDIFSMSDEDALNLSPSSFITGDESVDETDVMDDQEIDQTDADENIDQTEGEADGDETEQDADLEDEEGEQQDEEAGEAAAEGEAAELDSESDSTEDSETETSTDYEAEYKRLLAPFKANGKEQQVKNVDEAIQLMQMGANYNKKMAALKPSLKTLKMLEKNGLLSEDKLSYLIDLDQKNPEAIAKLIKDSGIDPLDIDVNSKAVNEYKPQARGVEDQEIELDGMFEELRSTPTYQRLMSVVTDQWDNQSQSIVAQTPQLLSVINDHMASGVYDVIVNEMERERMFGRLAGLSDLDAYKTVGDALHERGGFDHLFQQEQSQPQPVQRKVITPNKQAANPGLKSKKRAASSSGSGAKQPTAQDFNPLAMSDEEYEKLINPRFS